MLPAGRDVIYTYPTEAFMLYIRIALIAGLFIAAPLILWQVWLFVAPALYSHKERRFAIPFVLLSSIGFIAGAAFSHYVAFPLMWRFFASFSNDLVTFMPRIEDAFSLYMRMLLGMALVFQMPSLVFFLAQDGRRDRALDDSPVQVRGAGRSSSSPRSSRQARTWPAR